MGRCAGEERKLARGSLCFPRIWTCDSVSVHLGYLMFPREVGRAVGISGVPEYHIGGKLTSGSLGRLRKVPDGISWD